MAILGPALLGLLLATSGMAEASGKSSEKRICKQETSSRTGTRLQRQTSCLTAAQWEKRKNETDADVQLQEHSGKYNIDRMSSSPN